MSWQQKSSGLVAVAGDDGMAELCGLFAECGRKAAETQLDLHRPSVVMRISPERLERLRQMCNRLLCLSALWNLAMVEASPGRRGLESVHRRLDGFVIAKRVVEYVKSQD